MLLALIVGVVEANQQADNNALVDWFQEHGCSLETAELIVKGFNEIVFDDKEKWLKDVKAVINT